MGFAKSTRAQNKIRYWLNIHQRERAIEMGKKLLEKQARKYRLALKDFNEKTMDTIGKEYGLGGGQDLLAGIRYGEYSAPQVLAEPSPGNFQQTPAAEEGPQGRSTLGTGATRMH